MFNLWLPLILMLLVILVSAEIFTNALEHAGDKLGISEGVTGSIFAAIATALPETMVPILAIFAGTANQHVNEQISVGAILGAPLMLSTLTTLLMALFAIKKRGVYGKITPERSGFVRDLNFFLAAFLLAAAAMYVPDTLFSLRVLIGAALILLYIIYLSLTFRMSKHLVSQGHHVSSEEPLFLTKLKLKNNSFTISMQLILGLLLLFFGAKGFIISVENVSEAFHISALILSLLIVPIATELPEKINSIIWIRKNKDTLAFGNITGAMVFQGTLLPALGILLTPWQPSKEVLTSIIITFIAAAWLRLNALSKGVKILALLANGLFYIAYLGLIMSYY